MRSYGSTEKRALNERQQICFYCPYTGGGHPTGARARTEGLITAYRHSGRRVFFLGPLKHPQCSFNIKICMEGSPFSRLINGFKAWLIIKRLRCTLVIAEGPLFPFFFGQTKLVSMIHDAKFATQHRRNKGFITWFYWLIAARVSAKIVTVSEPEKRRLVKVLQISANKIIVSKNGIDDEWMLPLAENKPLEYDLLYVSNFAPHKNHLGLLKSVVNLRLRIVFVGSDLGTFREVDEYVNKNNLNVSYFSHLSTEDLISIYDRSLVFVFPSNLEGFGIPYLEARARGLPVLASDLEIFRDHRKKLGGTIVDFSNAENLSSHLAETKIKRERNGRQVPKNLDEYRWPVIAEKLLSDLE